MTKETIPAIAGTEISVLAVGHWDGSARPSRQGSSLVSIHHCDVPADIAVVADSIKPHWLLAGGGIDDSQIRVLLNSVRAVIPSAQLAVLGDPADWRRCAAWFRRGCRVYLGLRSDTARIESAIRLSTSHDVSVADRSFQRIQETHRTLGTPELTTREMEVLEMLHRGLGNREIAAILHVTKNTVEYHMKNLLQKLGARSRLEAVERSLALGLR